MTKRSTSARNAVLLGAECAMLYGLLPLLFCYGWLRLAKWPALLVLLAVALWLASRQCSWRVLLRPGALRAHLPQVLLRAALAALVIAALTLLFLPQNFLHFPRVRPRVWALVMLLYPLLSAYPQELIYRTCFFQRYAPLFASPRAMLVASSLAFAWLHIVFCNVPALVLSLAGGMMLSHTYQRSHSTLAVTVEHALYGCLLFTIGLGRYFYLPR